MTFERANFGMFVLLYRGRMDSRWKPHDHILLMHNSLGLVPQLGRATSLLESLMAELMQTLEQVDYRSPVYESLMRYAIAEVKQQPAAQMDVTFKAFVEQSIKPLLKPRLVMANRGWLKEPPMWRLTYQWMLDGANKTELEWTFKPVITYEDDE